MLKKKTDTGSDANEGLTGPCCIRAIQVLLLCSLPITASALLRIDTEQISTANWQLKGLQFQLRNDSDTRTPLHINIDEFSYADSLTLTNLSLDCPEHSLTANLVVCSDGRFQAHHASLGDINGRIDLRYDINAAVAGVNITQLRLAGATLEASIQHRQGDWQVSFSARVADASETTAWLASHPVLPFAPAIGKGAIELDATFTGFQDDIHSADLVMQTRQMDLSIEHEPLLYESEGLGLKLTLNLERLVDDWALSGQMQVDQGIAYIEPGFRVGALAPGFYLEWEPRPLQLDFLAQYRPEDQQVTLQSLTLEQTDVMQVRSHGNFDLASPEQLDDLFVTVLAPSLPKLYTHWLQPLLLDTVFSELQISGAATASLRIQGDEITDLGARFMDVYAEDKQSRFSLYGLEGDFVMNSTGIPQYSQLGWQGAGIYRLQLGATSLALQSSHSTLKLREPVDIPLLDGHMNIDRMELARPGREDVAFFLDGILTPVSLEAFSQAMDWPLMSGKLSGVVPGLRYENHRLSMDGNLLIRAFEGSIPIRDLEVTHLFSTVPRLSANIDFHQLNLETLTSTFSFGRITGLLDGHIHGLQLEAWQPVSFEAAFRNPGNDEQRHRISQRAVDDLTSIGGGIPTFGLSSGFMKFFDEFGYGELALGCILEQGICHMSGVEADDDAYVILTRGLLPPWIEIRGYNRQVDWSVLVERLRDIIEGESPVIN